MISKKGFTLSEVMITLGLIGVLSAILIPTVTKITPSNNKVMLRKANYTLQKTISTMINDDTNYPPDQTGTSTDTPPATVERGFNYTAIPTGSNVPTGNNKFCYLFTQSLNTVETVDCTVGSTWAFSTTDGILWTVYSTGFNLNAGDFSSTLVTVDVNGAKTPNCNEDGLSNPTVSACVGTKIDPDTFQFGIRYDGKIQVLTSDNTAANILSNPTDNQK